MNLINCVEYAVTNDSKNTLFIMPDSCIREGQIKELLSNPVYSSVFEKVIFCYKTRYRILNFFGMFLSLLRLRLMSTVFEFNEIITGNYRNYGARLSFTLQRRRHHDCKLIVCDDGLATIMIGNERINEMQSRRPYMFIPNRLEDVLVKRKPQLFIPDQVTFFTSYTFDILNTDSLIKNEYNYLKNHLDCFEVNDVLFRSGALFIGQPLYTKGYVSVEKYRSKLLQYAHTVNERIIYYAHPEENEKQWKTLGISDKYVFVNNILPFEIIAALLPAGCHVASFFSSVLMNLRTMNKDLIPECVVFKQIDLSDKADYVSLIKCYNSYKSENVLFYEFD